MRTNEKVEEIKMQYHTPLEPALERRVQEIGMVLDLPIYRQDLVQGVRMEQAAKGMPEKPEKPLEFDEKDKPMMALMGDILRAGSAENGYILGQDEWKPLRMREAKDEFRRIAQYLEVKGEREILDSLSAVELDEIIKEHIAKGTLQERIIIAVRRLDAKGWSDEFFHTAVPYKHVEFEGTKQLLPYDVDLIVDRILRDAQA